MSDDKRKLLALRLKQRATKKPEWFSGLADRQAGKLSLFCFPYAGGGTMLYRLWREALPNAAVVAVRLPGRESRMEELPFTTMGSLVEALAAEVGPYLGEPFAFFGHSMGAIVAFELTRHLRASGRSLPQSLHVSAARAPQFRLHHEPGPEPDEQSFLEELRRLEGMPREVLDKTELMRVALPALRADANLYRQYVYQPADPLPVPIHAYGGISDPNIRREHLERWQELTTREFSMEQFEGGHFFLQTAQSELLGRLAAKL
jgi:medium-chain acyl-[acyl-carrier-protein] hydrolase